MSNCICKVWQYCIYFALFFIQWQRRILHLVWHLHLTDTTHANKCKAAALWMVNLKGDNDISVIVLWIEGSSLAGTWLNSEVRWELINISYSVCNLCWFSCEIFITLAYLFGVSLTSWSLAKTAIVISFSMLKLWIRCGML